MIAQARRFSTKRYMIILGVFAALLTVAALGPRFSFSIGVEGSLLPGTPAERSAPLPAPLLLAFCGGGVMWAALLSLHALRRVMVGALINAVEQQRRVGTSSFELAWAPAWRQGRQLFALSLVANLPLIVMLSLLAVRSETPLVFVTPFQVLRAEFPLLTPLEASIGVTLWGLLGLWRLLAERALLLEGLPFDEAIVRGGGLLLRKGLPALALYVPSVGLMALLGVMFFVGGVYVVVCFLLWPSMLALMGLAQAFLTTYWTLLYGRWAGLPHAAS